jgi:hypothetical protein
VSGAASGQGAARRRQQARDDSHQPTRSAPLTRHPTPADGGGWKRLGRRTGLGLHGNVGRAFAARGYVVAVISYRLSAVALGDLAVLYAALGAVAAGVAAVAAAAAAAAATAAGGGAAAAAGRPGVAAAAAFAATVCACFAYHAWRQGGSGNGCGGGGGGCSRAAAGTEPARHPDHVRDAAAATAWLARHAHVYGGDGGQLSLLGHSAGGHIVSLLALQPRWLADAGVPHGAVTAAVCLSGVYDAGLLELRGAAGPPPTWGGGGGGGVHKAAVAATDSSSTDSSSSTSRSGDGGGGGQPRVEERRRSHRRAQPRRTALLLPPAPGGGACSDERSNSSSSSSGSAAGDGAPDAAAPSREPPLPPLSSPTDVVALLVFLGAVAAWGARAAWLYPAQAFRRAWLLRPAFGPDAAAWDGSLATGVCADAAALADRGCPPILLVNSHSDLGLGAHTALLAAQLAAARALQLQGGADGGGGGKSVAVVQQLPPPPLVSPTAACISVQEGSDGPRRRPIVCETLVLPAGTNHMSYVIGMGRGPGWVGHDVAVPAVCGFLERHNRGAEGAGGGATPSAPAVQ